MKKILALGALILTVGSTWGAVLATNTPGGGVYLLSTNRASIYSIELTSLLPSTVAFYDNDSVAAPYFGTNFIISGSYVTRQSYPTNYVTSFVGYNGYTNWYTNAGLWTATVTNAASTNAMSPAGVFVVAGGTYAVYNTDMLMTKGVCITTDTNVTVIVNYRTGR